MCPEGLFDENGGEELRELFEKTGLSPKKPDIFLVFRTENR